MTVGMVYKIKRSQQSVKYYIISDIYTNYTGCFSLLHYKVRKTPLYDFILYLLKIN